MNQYQVSQFVYRTDMCSLNIFFRGQFGKRKEKEEKGFDLYSFACRFFSPYCFIGGIDDVLLPSHLLSSLHKLQFNRIVP